MGGITSGVGIFSGINSAQLIDQLLAIDQRPKVQIQRRSASLQQQRAAFLDINTTLSALKSASTRFRTASAFDASRADSSDAAKITASAASNAAAGSYQFTVKRLVTSQQFLSRGFADSTSSGVGATSFTFELGGGGLSSDTLLSELNGGNGVERGKILVRDASGASATVDLSTVKTVGDVLDTLNAAAGVRIRATVDGDRIVVRDNNDPGATGALSISSATGYNTAASLGIAGSATAGAGNAINGSRVRTISGASSLATLNDGQGVNIRDGGPDLFIQARDGSTFNISLGEIKTSTGTAPNVVETVTQTRATTLQDVINIINTSTGGKVTAAVNSDGTGLNITDSSAPASGTEVNLIVRSAANTGRTTAKDLGIETVEAGVASNSIAGRRLISTLNSTLVSSLRGGSGITETAFTVTDRAGAATNITLGAGTLNGSVDDLITSINAQLQSGSSGARVALNRAGNGLSITDSSTGSGTLTVAGNAADQLGISTTANATGAVNGSNLQSKWLSRSTLVTSLNGGKGIGTGTIRISDAAGGTSTLNIGESIKTVDQLIGLLQGGGARVSVDVNANGDGIVVRDTSGGSGSIKIEDTTGAVAKSLNLVGTDDSDGGVTEINGSFERQVTFAATDALQTVANKINSDGFGISAAVIRDGSGATPFRLSLTSLRSGSSGRFVIDTKNINLGFSTLSRGDDSLAFYGAADPARAVLLSSSSNTLDNVIQGVTIDLKQASDTPVTVTVSRDTASVEKTFDDFVKAYNDTLDKLNRYDNFNSETNQAGLLFGDPAIATIRNTLRNTIQGTPTGVSGSMTRLFQVGLKVGDGGKLTIDKTKLRSMIEQDPQGVKNLVAARKQVPREATVEISPGVTVNNTSTRDTFTELGVLERLGEAVTGLTSSTDGTLTRRGRTIDAQITENGKRITQIDQRVESKRSRLERQFVDMERAISSLQSQSSALGSLSSIR